MRLEHLKTSIKIGLLIVSLLPSVAVREVMANEPELSAREKTRRERTEKYDRQNLRARTSFVKEHDPAFLKIPDVKIEGEFDVAQTPPVVKFQIFPNLEPEFFGKGADAYQAGWANWAYMTRSDDDRFFMAASDHRGRGSLINLYEYRLGADRVERILDVSQALGWHSDMYTDGKIHGHMGIMPNGDMWVGTHRGPAPTPEWYADGYRGSWLFSFNINTGDFKNWGVPLIANSLDCHTLDTERGIFFATGGSRATMLSWDVNEKRVRFAGYPPNGWVWHPRSILLDKATGIFWGNEISEQPYRFIAFDPELNEFKRFDVEVPANPLTGQQTFLRGHTHEPDHDGYYYWSTRGGALIRFRPDWENGPEVKVLGTNWDRGRDVLQMILCPGKRYVYYQPKGRHSPLVQYDIQTGRRKAICFLQEFFFEKYGYTIGTEVYGLEISSDGSQVAIVENGTFAPFGTAFGHPGLAVIEIPASERPLND